MARKIKIRWSTSRYILGRDDAIRIRIEVSCAEGLSDKIFAYRLLPKSPQTGSKRGYFSHVCSPADLADFPEDEPIVTHIPPWFRLNYVDLLVRSETESAAFIEDVRSDIRRLLASLRATDEVFFVGEDDFLTGIECETSSSSSSAGVSSSSSESSESSEALQSVISTGSFAQGIGFGQPWVSIGLGAGSPVGSSDSLDALNRNASRTALYGGLVSRQLLIQGYDFDDLPADAVLEGIVARLVLRDATLLGNSLASASSSSGELLFYPLLTYFRLYDPDVGFVGDDKANNVPVLGPEWDELLFGAASDLWNAEIPVNTLRNRGDFGVGLIIFLPEELDDAVVDIDGVELEVFFR